MDEHPIQGLMTTAMENIKDMIEVNTIIGEPVEASDGTIIIPVSKVGFGFAAGGSEFNSENNNTSDSDSSLPFGGGSGGGVSISPVAFLIVSNKGIKMIHMQENVHLYEQIIDSAPQVLDKIQKMMKENTNTFSEKASKDNKNEMNLNYDI